MIKPYKYAEWVEKREGEECRVWHTDGLGEGLWMDDKQKEGTCQFDVTGCKTEKAAKAKIRSHVIKCFLA